MWKRLRGRKSSQFILALAFFVSVAGGMVWVYAYPPGFQACGNSENRDFLVGILVERGFSVQCRKENPEARLMVSFPLRNFNQFIWWAGNQSIATIYEQPGYFWFLRTDVIPGFVTYGF